MLNIFREIVDEWKAHPDYYIGMYNRLFICLVLCRFMVKAWIDLLFYC